MFKCAMPTRSEMNSLFLRTMQKRAAREMKRKRKEMKKKPRRKKPKLSVLSASVQLIYIHIQYSHNRYSTPMLTSFAYTQTLSQLAFFYVKHKIDKQFVVRSVFFSCCAWQSAVFFFHFIILWFVEIVFYIHIGPFSKIKT